LDADLEQTKRMLDVNFTGLIGVTQAFAPLLLQSKGVVVNIGSISGVAPTPWQGVYAASKAAINHLTHILRLELEPFGVRVVLVSLPRTPLCIAY
jgi:1-acylglycerone phosphate reductase